MGTKLGTPTQINNTNPTLEELPADLYDCAICYDKIQKENNSKTKCGHYFCRTCLDAWLNINTTCPMCRTNIREHRSSAKQKPIHSNDHISRERQEIINRNIMERYEQEQEARRTQVILPGPPTEFPVIVSSERQLEIINRNIMERLAQEQAARREVILPNSALLTGQLSEIDNYINSANNLKGGTV